MATPHSGPYETQHPNPTDEEMHAEAGKILSMLKTRSISQVAREMGMCRDTVYARLKLISRQIPDVDVVRVIHYERLEEMFEGLRGRLDGGSTNADYARLAAEQRQVLARQSALLRVETSEPGPVEVDEEPDNWVAGAQAEADEELADAERELLRRRNGAAS